MISDLLKKLTSGEDLTGEEAEEAMKAMMGGQATQAEMAGFLIALKMKGESPGEIASLAKVMRNYATRLEPKVRGVLVDVCGTGGDGSGTFNISTAAAFVVAASGVPVAKHGNRGITSRSGSADALEALGAKIDLSPDLVKSCIENIGIGFMFAPAHHPAMRHVMPVRKELGVRTVFNILGPLTNPAGAKAQLMGVYDPKLTEPLAEAFRLIGHSRALVVYGEPGLDELSTAGATRVSELRDDAVKTYSITPQELGLKPSTLEDLRGGDPRENAATIRGILSGAIGGAKRDVVALNAAGGLIAGGRADGFAEGLRLAYKAIDSHSAYLKLEEFVKYTGG